jgi:hypothetical protein
MKFCTCSTRRALICALLSLPFLPSSPAQSSSVLSLGEIERPRVKRGEAFPLKLNLSLRPGFHVNSDKPSDEYLIPLRLTWGKGPLQSEQVTYPQPHMEKPEFSPKPLSVFSGNFQVVTKFRAAANAEPGMGMMIGKLRYQACNSRECLVPKTMDIQFIVDIQ